jgi:urease accessory protein
MMPDPARALVAHLSALQLADSGFPTGRYTLSYGLESLVQTGYVSTADNGARLQSVLCDAIKFGVGPSDGIALACAHRAFIHNSIDLDAVLQVDKRLTAVKISAEAREASARTGRALLRAATGALQAATMVPYAALVDSAETPGNHAVVLGMLSAVVGVPRLEAVCGELYAFSAAWVAAAVRLGVADHRTAQAVLHQARPVAAQAALAAADRDVHEISSCNPLLDVMGMRHEQAEIRLFAN